MYFLQNYMLTKYLVRENLELFEGRSSCQKIFADPWFRWYNCYQCNYCGTREKSGLSASCCDWLSLDA